MKTILFSVLTVLTLSFSPVVLNASSGINSTEIKIENNDYCGVSDDEILHYMTEQRINAVMVLHKDGTCNAGVIDTDGNHYIVYISEGIITGWDGSNG